MILGGLRMGVIKIREYSSFRVCKEGEFQGARDGNYTILKEETFGLNLIFNYLFPSYKNISSKSE